MMLALITIALGSGLAFAMVKAKWPGWMGLPLVFIILCIIRDLGAAPLMDVYVDDYWVNPNEGLAGPDEIGAASFLVLLSYISLFAGMTLVAVFRGPAPRNRETGPPKLFSPRLCSRAWNASLLLFLFSILCQAVVFYYLLKEVPLSDIPRLRSVFLAEATTNPLFSYARLLSNSMPVAVWGMLLFSRGSKRRLLLAVVGIVFVLLFEVAFGSRMQLIANVFGIAAIYHYGVKAVRFKHALLLVAMMVVGLVMIQFIRMGVSNVGQGVTHVAVDVLKTKSVNKAAFAMRHFPGDAPFVGVGFISSEMSKLAPTIRKHLTWNRNVWYVVVDRILSGRSGFKGKGGNHYTLAAESYMQFGVGGVVFIGLFVGLFYGLIFSWQRRHPRNVFLLMFAAYAFVAFAMGLLNGKMLAWISSMGFGAILPIGFLSVWTFRDNMEAPASLLFLWLCMMSLLAKRLLAWPEPFDVAFAISLVFLYMTAMCSISRNRGGDFKG